MSNPNCPQLRKQLLKLIEQAESLAVQMNSLDELKPGEKLNVLVENYGVIESLADEIETHLASVLLPKSAACIKRMCHSTEIAGISFTKSEIIESFRKLASVRGETFEVFKIVYEETNQDGAILSLVVSESEVDVKNSMIGKFGLGPGVSYVYALSATYVDSRGLNHWEPKTCIARVNQFGAFSRSKDEYWYDNSVAEWRALAD